MCYVLKVGMTLVSGKGRWNPILTSNPTKGAALPGNPKTFGSVKSASAKRPPGPAKKTIPSSTSSSTKSYAKNGARPSVSHFIKSYARNEGLAPTFCITLQK